MHQICNPRHRLQVECPSKLAAKSKEREICIFFHISLVGRNKDRKVKFLKRSNPLRKQKNLSLICTLNKNWIKFKGYG